MLVGLVVTCDRDAGSGAFVGVAVTLPLFNLAIFGLTNPHQVPGTLLPLFRQLAHVFQRDAKTLLATERVVRQQTDER